MKIKVGHLIILSVVSSVSLGRYLLTPEPASVEKPKATEIIVQSTKESSQPTIKQRMDWLPQQSAVTFESPVLDEVSLQINLNKTLTTLRPDESVHLSNLSRIAHCPSCLQSLQNYLLTVNFSEAQLTQLVDALSVANHPEFAILLIETVEKIAQRSADDPHEAILINALAKFNSAQVAKMFANYLVSDRKISQPLQDALKNSINETTTGRGQIAADIVKQFNETHDVTVREKLLTIDQPEALAQISSQALQDGDIKLHDQTNEQLKSNPSRYTLDALLSMEQIKSANIDQVNQVVDAAYQLAARQFSGNRLDYIEAKLAQGVYSEQDRSLILDVLSHSEDKTRSSEIIAKFSN
jgi:hypothetical protein